jgi:hypothetical protein
MSPRLLPQCRPLQRRWPPHSLCRPLWLMQAASQRLSADCRCLCQSQVFHADGQLLLQHSAMPAVVLMQARAGSKDASAAPVAPRAKRRRTSKPAQPVESDLSPADAACERPIATAKP